MKKRFNIIVTGLVQGVGYRYFCKRKAMEYKLSGYAKNLYNGNVQIVIEGDYQLITYFMNDLKVGPFGANVKSVNYEEAECGNDFSEFSIL